MDRKYGHKGYQDTPRDDRNRDRKHCPPVTPLTPEEKAQQRSVEARGAAGGQRGSCAARNCGRNVAASGAVSFGDAVPTLRHFPPRLPRVPALRYERALGVPRADHAPLVADKSKANTCPSFFGPARPRHDRKTVRDVGGSNT